MGIAAGLNCMFLLLILSRRINEIAGKSDPKSMAEGLEIAPMLAPRIHFIVDDVDWDAVSAGLIERLSKSGMHSKNPTGHRSPTA
jgi:hypothetical protein